MRVDLYFCNDCRKYFLLEDKHVRDGHIQYQVDCDCCGSKRGAFLIRNVNLESRNWVPVDSISAFAMDEDCMRYFHSSGDDSGLEFGDWLVKYGDGIFELDMDEVRRVCDV